MPASVPHPLRSHHTPLAKPQTCLTEVAVAGSPLPVAVQPISQISPPLTAQRYRGLKASQVPKSDRNIPVPKRVAERLNQILLDSLPE